MIRLCLEVLGFFLFITLLVNIGKADEQINYEQFKAQIQRIIISSSQYQIEIVEPKLDDLKIKLP